MEYCEYISGKEDILFWKKFPNHGGITYSIDLLKILVGNALNDSIFSGLVQHSNLEGVKEVMTLSLTFDKENYMDFLNFWKINEKSKLCHKVL